MHWFLRGLLNVWGLKLQHLNPTGVLHIAGFIIVCEAFLGMEPHVDLFRRIFSGQALSEGKLPKIMPVGGFSLQKKPKPLTPYPAYSPYDSNWGWHGEWFYIRNSMEASFLMFIRGRPEKRGKLDVGSFPSREKASDHRAGASEAHVEWPQPVVGLPHLLLPSGCPTGG